MAEPVSVHQPTAVELVVWAQPLADQLCMEVVVVVVVILVLPLQLQQIKVVTLCMAGLAVVVVVGLRGQALVAPQHLVVMAVLAVLTQT
jgi:hypothetical protein